MPTQDRAPARQRQQAPAGQSIAAARDEWAKAEQTAETTEAKLMAYERWFAAVLPPYLPVQAFLTHLFGVLRKDRKLAEAAAANWRGFLIAATECAQIGAVPGKDYHFLHFANKETGVRDIVGTEDYKYLVQLVLRAGVIDTLNTECVYKADEFDWQPTRMRVPHHIIRDEVRDNKNLRAVYAYGERNERRIGKCVVLYRAEVMKHKAKAPSKELWDGPWEYYAWMKTAIRTGQRYWGQSVEWQTEVMKATARALDLGGQLLQLNPDQPEQLVPPDRMPALPNGRNGEPPGEVLRHVTAEDEDRYGGGDGGWPEGSVPAQPRNGGHQTVAGQVEPPAGQGQGQGQQGQDQAEGEPLISKPTGGKLRNVFTQLGDDWKGDPHKDKRLIVACLLASRGSGKPLRTIASPSEMTEAEGLAALQAVDQMREAAGADGETLAARMGRFYDRAMAHARGEDPPGGPQAAGDAPEG